MEHEISSESTVTRLSGLSTNFPPEASTRLHTLKQKLSADLQLHIILHDNNTGRKKLADENMIRPEVHPSKLLKEDEGRYLPSLKPTFKSISSSTISGHFLNVKF